MILSAFKEIVTKAVIGKGKKYFKKDVYKTRNNYISVILDRTELNINKFFRISKFFP